MPHRTFAALVFAAALDSVKLYSGFNLWQAVEACLEQPAKPDLEPCRTVYIVQATAQISHAHACGLTSEPCNYVALLNHIVFAGDLGSDIIVNR